MYCMRFGYLDMDSALWYTRYFHHRVSRIASSRALQIYIFIIVIVAGGGMCARAAECVCVQLNGRRRSLPLVIPIVDSIRCLSRNKAHHHMWLLAAKWSQCMPNALYFDTTKLIRLFPIPLPFALIVALQIHVSNNKMVSFMKREARFSMRSTLRKSEMRVGRRRRRRVLRRAEEAPKKSFYQ